MHTEYEHAMKKQSQCANPYHVSVVEVLVLEAGDLKRGVLAESDVGGHVCELELHELGRGERTAELLAVESVLAGELHAELCGTEDTPGNAETGRVEAAEEKGVGWGERGGWMDGNMKREEVSREYGFATFDRKGKGEISQDKATFDNVLINRTWKWKIIFTSTSRSTNSNTNQRT